MRGFNTGEELNTLDENLSPAAFAEMAISSADKNAVGQMIYSNAGYVIASLMFEKALKMDWYEGIQKNVFTPLSITGALGDGLRNIDARGHYVLDGKLIE